MYSLTNLVLGLNLLQALESLSDLEFRGALGDRGGGQMTGGRGKACDVLIKGTNKIQMKVAGKTIRKLRNSSQKLG